MTMGMRPTQNAERNPVQFTQNVDQRVSWTKSIFGFWRFPMMKRFFGPKWSDVTDPESATGDPPNMATDKLVFDANTPFFSIRLTKTFYATIVEYKNGQWCQSYSGIWDYTPDSNDNWLYWDENDVSYAKSNNRVIEIIIDKVSEGE